MIKKEVEKKKREYVRSVIVKSKRKSAGLRRRKLVKNNKNLISGRP